MCYMLQDYIQCINGKDKRLYYVEYWNSEETNQNSAYKSDTEFSRDMNLNDYD